MNTDKPVLLSGIKPTGKPHIGNYFGAMRQWVEFQTMGTHQCFFMLADYHALNSIQSAGEMRERTHELVLSLLAIGLNPEKVVLFKQSDVPAHTELAWIFDTITTMPYLQRAHAYKDAVAKGSEVSVGTFTYPMLMAADILLYDTARVPVGADQKQHIEYARDTALKFNNIYGDTFVLPEEYIMPEVAIVPGIDGAKMSKSYGNTIPLFASRLELEELVMGIVTDSSGDRPENVYKLHALIKTERELEPIYEEHRGKYKALKEALLEDLDAFLTPMRERFYALSATPDAVSTALHAGALQARERAEKKIAEVRRAVGVA